MAAKSHSLETRAGACSRLMKKTAALGLGVSLLGAGILSTAGAASAADFTGTPVPVVAGAPAVGEDGAAAITWSPEISKNVLGAKLQDGPNADQSINGLGVWPGQSAKYEILVDRDAPVFTDSTGAVRALQGFSVSDQLPAGMSADVRSLTIFDPSAGADGHNLVAGKDYTVTVSKENVLSLKFSNAWIAANVDASKTGRLSVVFTATLAETAAPYSAQENHASQAITLAAVDAEGVLSTDKAAKADVYTFATKEPATVLVPGVTPTEKVLGLNENGGPGEEIDKEVAVGGDVLVQSIALDGTFGESAEDEAGVALASAYDITRFGIIDDYDESVVGVDKQVVAVLDADGNDVTSAFNVTTSKGVLSVLAKTVKGAVPVDLLGQDYTVQYLTAVRDDITEDSVVTSTTVEVINDREHPVAAESSVAVRAIAPAKSVVTEEGSRVAAESIASGSEFWYRVVSSAHPANALYPVTSWSATDVLTAGDQQLHDKWSVRAVGNILDDSGKVLFADGAVIASNETRSDWFKLRFNGDSWSAAASGAFLDTVSAQGTGKEAADAQWELYVSATRIADEGTRTSNTGHEERNQVERSATVTTVTDAPVVIETPVPEETAPATEAPVETDKPTTEPTETPAPTEKPTPAPTETDKPVATEKPVVTPTADPTKKPVVDDKATDKPTVTKTKEPVVDTKDDKDGAVVALAVDDTTGSAKPVAKVADKDVTKASATTDLAMTGASGTTIMGIGAGALLLAGAGAMYFSRRGRGAHDVAAAGATDDK